MPRRLDAYILRHTLKVEYQGWEDCLVVSFPLFYGLKVREAPLIWPFSNLLMCLFALLYCSQPFPESGRRRMLRLSSKDLSLLLLKGNMMGSASAIVIEVQNLPLFCRRLALLIVFLLIGCSSGAFRASDCTVRGVGSVGVVRQWYPFGRHWKQRQR